MDNKIFPVILAGGTGTRLWPQSRQKYPKQFIKIIDNISLFQTTCLRFSHSDLFAPLTIITHEDYKFILRDQLRELHIENATIITEPVAKNTAAACLYAAKFLLESKGDVPIIFTPADHLIEGDKYLLTSIQNALPLAREGFLCLFGIHPTSAHSGYGYIIKGQQLAEKGFKGEMFVEKPDTQSAQKFIDQGAYWNSGVYFCLASTLIEETKIHALQLHERIMSIPSLSLRSAHGFYEIPIDHYKEVDSISIDHAITESTQKKVVFDTPIKWRDLGSWSSLYEQFQKNEEYNVLRGDTITLDTTGSYIESNSRLVATYGIENMAIIETPDAVLVFPIRKSESLKQLVEKIKESNRQELITHTTVYRPWGSYEILGKGENFQTKRIHVLPGAELSLQRHQRRAEHWVVISGTATVTKDNEILELRENESTYIPMGTIHRLKNNTDSPVSLIETQTGTYFGEDDIERLSDVYGRM